MDFNQPTPFNAAAEALRQKGLLPTNLSTVELRQYSDEIRQLSLYSARTTSAEYLAEVQKVVADMASGKINEATGRQLLQNWLRKVGYSPDTHFGTEADRAIAPAEKGSLLDLSSDRRIKLVIQMNVRLAQNTGFMQSGMDPDALYDYPCWELIRIHPRRVPRGEKETKDGLVEDPENSWEARWDRAGGTLSDSGRMIARKDDPIWDDLADSGTFDDGTDNKAVPWFNTGAGFREVSREESIQEGVIKPDAKVEAAHRASLLTGLFDGHPERKTLADLKATRSDLLAAVAELRRAA